jgi:hypothetical protein
VSAAFWMSIISAAHTFPLALPVRGRPFVSGGKKWLASLSTVVLANNETIFEPAQVRAPNDAVLLCDHIR